MNNVTNKAISMFLNVLMLAFIILWLLNASTNFDGMYKPYFDVFYVVFMLLTFPATLLLSAKNLSQLKFHHGSLLMALALLAWGIGEALWYYFVHYSIDSFPYPSVADAAYLAFYPLAIASTLFHIKAISGKELANIKFIRTFWTGLAVIITFSYLLLTLVGTAYFGESFVKTFFDVSYTVWDALLLIFLIVMFSQIMSSEGLHKTLYKGTVTVVAGLLVLFIADMTFSYMSELEIYVDGNFVDLMFMFSAYCLAAGTNKLSQGYNTLATTNEIHTQ